MARFEQVEVHLKDLHHSPSLSGSHDFGFPVETAREFARILKKTAKPTFPPSAIYIEFPMSHRSFYMRGMRAHYLAYGIERFLSTFAKETK